VALPGKRVGEKIFFLRFSTDAIVLLTNWVREGLYCYAVGTNTFRDWSCFFSLEEYSQLKLKWYSTVQLWFMFNLLRSTSEELD